MIKLQVIGNIGKDATVNNVNGRNVINFSVCHTEKYKDAQGVQKDKSVWVDCAKWGEKTGIVPYLTKGTKVYVEGTCEVRTWNKDGKSGASLVLNVVSVELLGGNQQQVQQPVQHPSTTTLQSDPLQSDDLPF